MSYFAWFIEDRSNLPGSHPDCLDEVDGMKTADALDILRVITELGGAALRQPLAHGSQPEVVESELFVSMGRSTKMKNKKIDYEEETSGCWLKFAANKMGG